MPRKKQTIVTETLPDTPGAGDSMMDTESVLWDSDQENQLARLRQQYAGAQLKTKVYKQIPGRPLPQFIFSTDGDVPEEDLQEHGEGHYILRTFVEGELRQTLHAEVGPKPNKIAANGTNDATLQSIHALQLQLLVDQRKADRDLIMALITRPPGASTPLSELVAATNLMHSNGNGNGIDSMIKGIELALKLSPGGGGDGMDWKSALISATRDVVTAVAPAVLKANGIPIQETQPQPETLPENPAMINEQMLKQGLAFLKQKIVSGLPVDVALDWVLNNAQDYQPLIDLALNKTFEDIVKIDGELVNEPFNSWMRRLQLGIQEHYKSIQDENSEE